MAGITKQGAFAEKISPFLKQKMAEVKATAGEDSSAYQGLFRQYVALPEEQQQTTESNRRHWEADLLGEAGGEQILRGLERLYDRSMVIEPTMICAAHCRYCLRANYDIFTLSESELTAIARYCGRPQQGQAPYEVLITGGDPLIVPNRLNFLVEALIEHAPNIRVIRIATRLPQQSPERINNNVYEIFRKHRDDVRFEIATQINHAVELFPEVRAVFHEFRKLGVVVYGQNVILKGVNDHVDTLVALYNCMRELDIEAHYLFHCVPMKSMHHLRTSVAKALVLYQQLTNSGRISGRSKPMGACMTDIGKITLYHGTVLDRNDKNQVLLQSAYRVEERRALNPNWIVPATAEVDAQGYLRVWYLDGCDEERTA